MVECPNVITCHQRVGQCSREMMPFSAFSIVSSLGVLGTQQWLLSVLLNPYILLTYPSCKVCFVHKPMTRERGWQISIPQIFLSTWLIRNSFSGKPLCEIHLDKNILIPSTHSQIVSVVIQALGNVQLFATQWTAACQVFLSFTISQSLPKLMSIESMMPSNYLILCCPLLLLSIFPSIRVFSNEFVPYIRWPHYWSFNISCSNEYSGLISFRIDWFDLLAVQQTRQSLLQHHNS